MKVKIGAKEYGFTIRDIIYILGLVVMASGWFVDHRVTKFKNELKDQVQDEKIQAQSVEIRELKNTDVKQKGYVKENANNILWIVRVLELDSD